MAGRFSDRIIYTLLHQCTKPTLGKWAKSSREIRREEIVLARARIGHSHLTHGYLLRREMPPVCIPCQKTRAEVIISEVEDEGKDLEFMTGLCEKMKQTSKPKQVSRNGRKNPEKNRLMKEINDLILDHEFEVLVITKTWLRGNIGDNAVIAELTPSSFKVDYVPRDSRGGGVAVVSRKNLRLNNMSKLKYSSLEFMDFQLDTQPKVRIVLIYRPPHVTVNPFMEEFEGLLEKLSGVGGEILI
ncbi:hypothetical protein CAPTEDRAFT_211145 [Capitella teleta]|uniref:Endonuclease/exonuclease/phosphatase domain-containing protein n=1 Tax=Capitella teleta TaxID=283909 RepID=R7TPV0_CAPTE|nr:hypothetical protein CAPTEDRAFT_211145 [Capitella teleta]|eukprot:ELT93070.1 hypothetical protein CAPTEDRAFT_211145 [Capitella teleta]